MRTSTTSEKTTQTRYPEIMAPAGSWVSFRAALQGGADSVYFGIEQLNMRARASNNFTLEDLPQIASLTKEQDVKTYLTLNTVLYDHDLPLMRRIVDAAKEAGITAIIAADQSAISYAYKQDVEVHISTQANISNIEMVEFYSHFADVMVLARELSLGQVRKIVEGIEERQITGPSGELVEIEVFAHGALCMAVSGKCYLSLHAYNSSANRGACKQNCRHSYKVTNDDGNELEIDNEYIMSPKDLCTIDFLDQLLDAGIQVLKLEGRGRSPEYVKTVTRCYREAAQAVVNGEYNREKVDQWMQDLRKVYNRGFWDGYYLGRRLGEWSNVHGSAAEKEKTFIGKVLHYYPKAEVAHIRIKTKELSLDDDILIIGKKTGVAEPEVASIWVDDQPAEKAVQGQECTLKIDTEVREGDKVYLWEDRAE
ncbi:peptidase U32 family protein [Fodinibius halophilus]|uniref:U32 family peptidase n=1 Tax=Fodinibius halophilus TaxID=1736908 RepID=A0A6M1T8H9_9BACT|nr:peptidase U32 family protein [Fodinibius halophilus]NGP86722.1 U32 family peptidase [Fodinibius halophilus]